MPGTFIFDSKLFQQYIVLVNRKNILSNPNPDPGDHNMFDIIKQLEANRIHVEAPKRSIWQKLVGLYKSYKGKKAYQALIIAKREEKAAAAKTNAELATEMEARSEALINESVLCYRTNKVESDRLMEEATELATKAASLRFL